MNIFRQKKQQILRFLFGSFSATALMFTFQACYGMPNDYFPVRGKVVSETTGEPLSDVRVGLIGGFEYEYGMTDSTGDFYVNAHEGRDSVRLAFRHIDSETGGLSGQYAPLDSAFSREEIMENPLVIKMKENSVE
jgi:hypothetical protein